jgi:arginase
VVAGDCPVLLAPLIAAKANGGAGLAFIDGHEDAWDPHVTPTGEASDCEIGLALGLFGGPAALARELPCLSPDHLAVLGARDQEEIADAGQPSIRDHVAHYRSGAELAAEQSYVRIADAVTASAATAEAGWWCHVDLDVLDTTSLSAVDYQQPGGITWIQLERLTAACLRVPGCLGASVAIYNPDLDDGHAGGRIVEYIAFIRDLLSKKFPIS